jgi:hypothetical protein
MSYGKSDSMKSEKGQSLTEFAISMTIFIILVAGIVDFGRAFFTYMAIRDAAQEGAAYGSVNPSHRDGIVDRVLKVSSNPLNLDDLTIEPVINFGGAPCSGNEITVTITYNYRIIMPFLGTILGTQEIPLRASVTDYIVRPPCP